MYVCMYDASDRQSSSSQQTNCRGFRARFLRPRARARSVRAEHAPRVLIRANHAFRLSFQNMSLIAKKMADLKGNKGSW